MCFADKSMHMLKEESVSRTTDGKDVDPFRKGLGGASCSSGQMVQVFLASKDNKSQTQ